MPGLKRNAETTRSKDDKKELAISTVISVRGLVNEIDGKVCTITSTWTSMPERFLLSWEDQVPEKPCFCVRSSGW